MTRTVVKIGGSLYDLPDLGSRISRCLETLEEGPFLLVAGGGPTADAVRTFHRTHELPEVVSHWLAIRGMSLNAHFLAAIIPGSRVVKSFDELPRGAVGLLDAYAFLAEDETRPDHLPHTWTVTSDSIAARVARVTQARRLVLFKSVEGDPWEDWAKLAFRGQIDPYFATAVQGTEYEIRWVNLRRASYG